MIFRAVIHELCQLDPEFAGFGTESLDLDYGSHGINGPRESTQSTRVDDLGNRTLGARGPALVRDDEGEFTMPDYKGTPGSDSQTGSAGRDLMYGYAGDDTFFGGDGNDVLYGGAGEDSLFGGAGNDQLSGGDGNDNMFGGIGDDTFYAEDSGDQVVELGGEGTDTVVSSLANYALDNNVEVLRLREGAAVDSAGRTNGTGNDLSNSIRGNSVSNALQGKGGNDSIYGLEGDDIISGGTGNDLIDGGDGTDEITFKVDAGTQGATVDLSITVAQETGFGRDFIRNIENLEGTANSDTLSGNAGANKIAGLGGGDLIRGRGGNDDLTGGEGADIFRFDSAGAGNGVDRIRGFVVGSDRLEFHTADGYDAASTFTFGPEAVGAGPQGVYDITTGMLYYDADGEGGNAAILIAQFDRGLALTGNDIGIVNDAPQAGI